MPMRREWQFVRDVILNYIHRNLYIEKRRLAENPEDYKYSSATNYILGTGAYDVDVMEF